MSITITELETSRSGDTTSSIHEFHISGEANDSVVWATLNTYTAATWDSLVKQNVAIEAIGNGLWTGSVTYGRLPMPEVNTGTWSFEFGSGELVHIQQAISQTAFVASGTAPDPKGAINVRKTQDGANVVDGLDIDAAVSFRWSETWRWPYATANSISFINLIKGTLKRTNDAAWRIFSEGEVRLLRVAGEAQGEAYVPVTYEFEAETNVTGLTVGDITGISKKGFEYLWPYYKQVYDATAKVVIPQPSAVYVAKVFKTADFSALGLATPWT
jgi:hypothetical protein